MTQADVIEALKPCSKCQGKPGIKYEPGCLYTFCVFNHKDCPMANAVPDYEPEELLEKIND